MKYYIVFHIVQNSVISEQIRITIPSKKKYME